MRRALLRNLCIVCVIGICARLAITSDKVIVTTASGGTVEGRVLYETDAARPWRFQRYYVKDAKSGALAEAVVALRGRGLKFAPSPPADPVCTIDQFNYQFVPETTAIQAGQSLRFTNSDLTTHNIKSTADIATFNVNLEAEDEYTYRFERAGGAGAPVNLGCVFHGGMRAWVYVFDHPFFSVTGEDGRFRFEDVPPGRYTLEMVHPAGQLRWKGEVVVTSSETSTVEVHVSPTHKTLP
ncbi:MAG: hypothetical protein KF861_00230 [Planctomycetaceae bacterium]|nr:hypothetical protein [Planctomycetaceae bacterium]